MKHWWCAGCEAEVGLDRHGRCGICGSEAVRHAHKSSGCRGCPAAKRQKPNHPNRILVVFNGIAAPSRNLRLTLVNHPRFTKTMRISGQIGVHFLRPTAAIIMPHNDECRCGLLILR